MSRLIDVDMLISRIEEEQCKGCSRDSKGNCPSRCALVDIQKKVHELPTIDAVPVVRCEECCYWKPPTYTEQEDGSTVGHCTAALNGQQTDAYWFCADGMR